MPETRVKIWEAGYKDKKQIYQKFYINLDELFFKVEGHILIMAYLERNPKSLTNIINQDANRLKSNPYLIEIGRIIVSR